MKLFLSPHIRRLIDLALDEDDLGLDVTSNAFFAGESATGRLVAKENIVVCGLPMVEAVFERVDPNCYWKFEVSEGDSVVPGTEIGRVAGDAVSILRAERTALNFLQRMSGVATKTFAYAAALQGAKPRITDTRKTLPGYRELDKYAVRTGGGANHRFSLAGGVMVKDNHIAAAGGIGPAVERVRAQAPHLLKIEVECENLAMVHEALESGAEVIMLDNMSTDAMREAIAAVREHSGDRVAVEISGNVTLDRLPALAELDADFISSGALTHSAIAADISMKFSVGD
jgi:nicotinate-nucleotide pyrophosphorylase (carboxylating)